MPEFSFELPRINFLVDGELRKKLLGDVPTLEDILPKIELPDLGSLLGSSGIVDEEEDKEEHLG